MSSLIATVFKKVLRTQDNLAHQGLMALPPEILHMIAERLPLAGAVSLSLCNHNLSVILGRIYWPLIRLNRSNISSRRGFLRVLARDLCSWFFCLQCSQLHPRDRVDPPGPAFRPKERLRCARQHKGPTLQLKVTETWYRFTFHHLQLTMDRYRLGINHGMSTDSLSLVIVRKHSNNTGEVMTYLDSFDVHVCTNPVRLCLRNQMWTTCSTRTPPESVPLRSNDSQRCSQRCSQPTLDPRVIQSIKSKSGPRNTATNTATKCDVQRSRSCHIDFQFEVKEFNGNTMAFICTQWFDLGSDSELPSAKNSDHWKSNASDVSTGRQTRNTPLVQAVEIRSAFEKETKLSQQALTLQNEFYLTKARYKRAMGHHSPLVWILQGGRRVPFYWNLKSTLAVSVVLAWYTLFIIKMIWPNDSLFDHLPFGEVFKPSFNHKGMVNHYSKVGVQ